MGWRVFTTVDGFSLATQEQARELTEDAGQTKKNPRQRGGLEYCQRSYTCRLQHLAAMRRRKPNKIGNVIGLPCPSYKHEACAVCMTLIYQNILRIVQRACASV